ncbi:MAG: sialate O-acetylesterase [Akkermansiaceae bacterium]
MKILPAICGLLAAGQVAAAVKLPAVLSDHAVLTRTEQVPIWGWADPGEEVTVNLGEQTAKTRAGAGGKWRVDLNLSKSPDGPFELTVAGTNRLVVKDVIVGEVWVASGQSNMDWRVGQSLEAKEEAARPANPLIRQFSVAQATALDPAEDCVGHWIVAAPDTVGEFTAVGYFFARNLSERRNVAVGLLHASWGGMNIERWIGGRGFALDPDISARAAGILSRTRESVSEIASYQKKLDAWQKRFSRGDVRNGKPADYAAPDVNTRDWKPVTLPGTLAAAGLPDAGSVWMRRTVDYPKVLTGTQFNIGHPEGFVEAYWNGERVGVTSPQSLPAGDVVSFFVAEDRIKPGPNTLAIRLFQPSQGAAITKPSSKHLNLDYGGKPLEGEWLAKVENALPPLTSEALATIIQTPVPIRPSAAPSCMFNAMVNPLVPHAIRGFLWYQGEANVERATQYETMLQLLIKGWRETWEMPDAPFLICQLANLGKPPATPGESKLAELRESQSKARSLPNTGIVVLMDIGEAEDIHPRSKKEAARRLALSGLALAYGEKIEFSGPLYDKMGIEGESIRLRFKHTGEGLVARQLPPTYKPRSNQPETVPLVPPFPESQLQGFALCGEDRKWVWADARIDGNSVIVSAPGIAAPVAVRYAWADNPVCNLYNTDGLPASPFRTDDFPRSTRDAVWKN